MLWAIPLALVLGPSARQPRRAVRLGFRWAPLAIGGLLVQVVLFTARGQPRRDPGPAIYVLSTLAVLVAVARNWRLTGMALVAAGALSNLAAIIANGGSMPADAGALAHAGSAVRATRRTASSWPIPSCSP